jgi:hypothetical protein
MKIFGSVLSVDYIAASIRLRLTGDVVKKLIRLGFIEFTSIIDIQVMQADAWQKEYANNVLFENSAITSLYNIVAEISSDNKIIIADPARRLGKVYVKKFFVDYSRYFFRFYGPFDDDNSWVGEPFVRQMFSINEEYDEFLDLIEIEMKKSENESLNHWLTWFWLKYLELKNKSFEPIIFSKTDLEIFREYTSIEEYRLSGVQ